VNPHQWGCSREIFMHVHVVSDVSRVEKHNAVGHVCSLQVRTPVSSSSEIKARCLGKELEHAHDSTHLSRTKVFEQSIQVIAWTHEDASIKTSARLCNLTHVDTFLS
jgi:hypothetical protein